MIVTNHTIRQRGGLPGRGSQRRVDPGDIRFDLSSKIGFTVLWFNTSLEEFMLITISAAAGILLAAILGFAATRPDTFRVRRSKSIQAPPERIFELINDFHKWTSWSPYEKLDPAMKKTYTGAVSGKGAVYEWAGNRKAGEGRMEITAASPASRIAIKLDFLKPFEGHNTAEFTMEAKGNATNLTWEMYGPQVYVAKVMTMFFSMENLVGKDFETGLDNIKAIAEK